MRPACVGAVAAAATLTVSLSGCRPESPDYQSILTTSSTSGAGTTITDPPVPLSQYLESQGITGEQVAPDGLTDLTVSIPTPPGWRPYRDPKTTTATTTIS
ncbi:MAG: LpqN/LpqT family lipoprotein, partial [Mycobacterium sp.]|nr:LpqN/LpqT family lipoprotein [Mycobacterium sp.]